MKLASNSPTSTLGLGLILVTFGALPCGVKEGNCKYALGKKISNGNVLCGSDTFSVFNAIGSLSRDLGVSCCQRYPKHSLIKTDKLGVRRDGSVIVPFGRKIESA